MCRIYFIRAETSEGKPYPNLEEGVEFEDYAGADGERRCICSMWEQDEEGDLARKAFLEALRPFGRVSWGNIIIEVR